MAKARIITGINHFQSFSHANPANVPKVSYVIHFLKNQSDADSALSKEAQCYERGGKDDAEQKLKNHVTPHHQEREEYRHPTPPLAPSSPTNTYSSQS